MTSTDVELVQSQRTERSHGEASHRRVHDENKQWQELPLQDPGNKSRWASYFSFARTGNRGNSESISVSVCPQCLTSCWPSATRAAGPRPCRPGSPRGRVIVLHCRIVHSQTLSTWMDFFIFRIYTRHSLHPPPLSAPRLVGEDARNGELFDKALVRIRENFCLFVWCCLHWKQKVTFSCCACLLLLIYIQEFNKTKGALVLLTFSVHLFVE